MIDVEARLTEWSRYVRTAHRAQHCGSAEHKYRSPQVWYPPNPRPHEINLERAQHTEWIITTLHRKYQGILVAHYVTRVRPQAAARKLHIRYTDYDATLNAACSLVAERLTATFQQAQYPAIHRHTAESRAAQ